MARWTAGERGSADDVARGVRVVAPACRLGVVSIVAPVAAVAVALAPGSALAAPSPSPAPERSAPTGSEVDDARAAEAAAAAEVAVLQERYEAAAATLRRVQGEVSAAATAYAESVAELERATDAANAATARAGWARKAAVDADRVLRDAAASAYMMGAGPMHDWAIYLSADGLQDLGDLSAGLDAIGSVNQGHLDEARAAARVAAAEQSAADRAEREQAAATEEVETALAAAQTEVAEAIELTTRLETQREEMVAELAALRRTTVAAEQARQDELEEAARRIAAGDGLALGPGGLPMVGSGGSASLTAAQLDPRSVAKDMVERSFGPADWGCLDRLWQAESGWRWSATNPSSGAYGIPQALPASKMSSAGDDWLVNPVTQITWGLGYISSRYGTPCKAWSAFQSRSPHWY